MEQPIWIAFGVIAILIGFGIIGKLFLFGNENFDSKKIEDNVIILKNQCNLVCQMHQGNRLKTDVILPDGTSLFTSEKRICIEIENKLSCEICNCNLEDYRLDINSTLSKKFKKLDYSCYFEKVKGGVSMECEG